MFDEAAAEVVTSGAYGHLVTINPDGRPHASLAWCDVDGDDVVFATLFNQRKLDNLSTTSGVIPERSCRSRLIG